MALSLNAYTNNNWIMENPENAKLATMKLLNYDDTRGMIYDKKLKALRKMTKKEKVERFLDEAIGKNCVDELLGKVTGSGTNFSNLITAYS